MSGLPCFTNGEGPPPGRTVTRPLETEGKSFLTQKALTTASKRSSVFHVTGVGIQMNTEKHRKSEAQRVARLLTACILLSGGIALTLIPGCVTENRRTPIGDSGAVPALAKDQQQLRVPAVETKESSESSPCAWVRLPVLEADVESWQGKQLLVVKTRVPSARRFG